MYGPVKSCQKCDTKGNLDPGGRPCDLHHTLRPFYLARRGLARRKKRENSLWHSNSGTSPRMKRPRLIFFFPLFFPPATLSVRFFTSSLAPLFGCGVCLKCNSGTIYDISAGARNKTHNYMCVVSGGGGSRSTAPRERHSSSTECFSLGAETEQ